MSKPKGQWYHDQHPNSKAQQRSHDPPEGVNIVPSTGSIILQQPKNTFENDLERQYLPKTSKARKGGKKASEMVFTKKRHSQRCEVGRVVPTYGLDNVSLVPRMP